MLLFGFLLFLIRLVFFGLVIVFKMIGIFVVVLVRVWLVGVVILNRIVEWLFISLVVIVFKFDWLFWVFWYLMVMFLLFLQFFLVSLLIKFLQIWFRVGWCIRVKILILGLLVVVRLFFFLKKVIFKKVMSKMISVYICFIDFFFF